MSEWITGPCDWPVEGCPDSDCPAPLDTLSEPMVELIEQMASQIMWNLTKGRFGPCDVSVYPCRDFGVSCGRCGHMAYGMDSCSCRNIGEIVLPGPVYEVHSVEVDGQVLDPDTYRVDDYAWLVRLDGWWPFRSDATAGPAQAGNFIVNYSIGMPPPAGAGFATGALACELAKAVCNDKSCRLPRTISSKTRQGVTVTFRDFVEGWTNIPFVDMWVQATNTPSQATSVWSPDMPIMRRPTWQAPTSPSSP